MMGPTYKEFMRGERAWETVLLAHTMPYRPQMLRALNASGLTTFGETVAVDTSALLELPGIGPKTIEYLKGRVRHFKRVDRARVAAKVASMNDAEFVAYHQQVKSRTRH